MTTQTQTQTLELGRVVATPGALACLERANQHATEFIAKHASGDWGTLTDHDRQLNDDAVLNGERILSVYLTRLGEKIWIITECDRSSTCVLMPEEY